MESAIYEGWVRHRRFEPKGHEFRSSISMMWLDLAELDEVFRGRWLWSASRPALAWFRRADHFGDPRQPLDEAVRDAVEERLGRRPAGRIQVLTLLRQFGYVFNPISVYFCRDASGAGTDAVLAEVSNTPWRERHLYALDPGEQGGAQTMRMESAKAFHVSPFMAMAMEYRWKIAQPGARVAIDLQAWRGGRQVFDATLALKRREIAGQSLARSLLRHPMMSAEAMIGIHWHALRLWLKGCPVYDHPKKGTAIGEGLRT